jgi:hypothetical protein
VAEALNKRFWLRLHMALMLGGTVVAGLIATNVLRELHVHQLAWRYGAAVCISFLAFTGFVRIWLLYIASCAARDRRKSERSRRTDWFDVIDFSSGVQFGGSSSSGSSASANSSMDGNFGGRGSFGGGGASGSWSDTTASQAMAAVPRSSSSAASGGSSGSGTGGGFGKLFNFDFDVDDDWGVVVLVLLLVLAIALAAFYLIWVAPAILSEIAFQSVLAAALARKAGRMTSESTLRSVVHATIIPFAIVLTLAVALGWYAQRHCPGATRLSEAMECGSLSH